MRRNVRLAPNQRRARLSLADLYDSDEVAWLERTCDLILHRRFRDLDYPHLAELLQDMAKRERREVKSRLVALLTHLLKWQFQPKRRSRSWQSTIAQERWELEDLLESGTLRNHAAAILAEAYQRAKQKAVLETGLAPSAFPEECPYPLEFLLADELPAGDESE